MLGRANEAADLGMLGQLGHEPDPEDVSTVESQARPRAYSGRLRGPGETERRYFGRRLSARCERIR